MRKEPPPRRPARPGGGPSEAGRMATAPRLGALLSAGFALALVLNALARIDELRAADPAAP